jgi:hypothetical protein
MLDSHDDGLPEVLARLDVAATAQEVVLLVREQVERLPDSASWLRGEIRDAEDISSCAVDLTRHRAMEGQLPGALAGLEILFARACVRVAQLLDPDATHRAFEARSQALPAMEDAAVGPPTPAASTETPG